jgi:hypothetical protein
MDANRPEGEKPYEIERTVDRRDVVPSVEEVVKIALAFGRDTVSLVRPEQGDKAAGIVVCMVGARALRNVGTMLREFAIEAHQMSPHDPKEVLRLTTKQSANWVLEWLSENKTHWCWGNIDVGGYHCTVAAFLGTELCTRIARRLTAYGVPTSLK